MSAAAAGQTARRRLRILRRPGEPILPAAPRPERRDCHGRLASALIALAGSGADFADAGFRPWCSATFIGAQHRFSLRLAGTDAGSRAANLARLLPDADWRIPGHIVADIAIDAVGLEEDGTARIDLAMLTIEDW